MTEHHDESIEEHEHHHHIVSPRIYITIVLALLFATGSTVWASYIDLGEWHIAPGITLFWNPVVALAIAATKMMLVVLFFMHVRYDPDRLHDPRLGPLVDRSPGLSRAPSSLLLRTRRARSCGHGCFIPRHGADVADEISHLRIVGSARRFGRHLSAAVTNDLEQHLVRFSNQ